MWDERYAGAGDNYLYGTEPNVFLKAQTGRLVPGQKALAVADGEGRNGVWPAQQGLKVVLIDASKVALEKARRLADSRGVEMRFEHTNLEHWAFPVAAFDLVVAIFIQFASHELRTRIFAGISQALKPGGLLLLHGYRLEQLEYATGGPQVSEQLYTTALLETAFPDLEVLSLNPHDSMIQEGTGHSGLSALIDLVAQKPAVC